MAPETFDSLDAENLKPLLHRLLARIDDLLAENRKLLARVAELEAKLGQPPKTPDNSSLPPSRGQKANAEPPAAKPPRKGRPGVARALAENPDVTRRFYAERCTCGAVLSDRLPAQCKHAEEHQFCLAHLIRDAKYAIEHGDTVFAPGLKALLKDACALGRRREALLDTTIAQYRRGFERRLKQLLALKPTDAEGRKLRDAIDLDCRAKLFVFLKRRDCEPTNNESERALRPSVIFRNYAQPTVMLSGRSWTAGAFGFSTA